MAHRASRRPPPVHDARARRPAAPRPRRPEPTDARNPPLLHARFGNAAVVRALEREVPAEERAGGPDDAALESPLGGAPASPDLSTATGGETRDATDAVHYDAPFGTASPTETALVDDTNVDAAEDTGVSDTPDIPASETRAKDTEPPSEAADASAARTDEQEPAADPAAARLDGKKKQRGAGGGAGPPAVTAAEEPAAQGGEAGIGNAEAANAALAAMASGEPAAVLDGLAQMPVSRVAEGMSAARQSSSEGFTQMQQHLAANPPRVMQPTGLPLKGAQEEKVRDDAAAEKERPRKVAPATGKQPPIPVRHEASRAPLPVSPAITAVVDVAREDSEELRVGATNALDGMPTTDPTIDVSPGPPPVVELTGEANPAEMDWQAGLNRATFDRHTETARTEASQDFGENDIYPTVVPAMLQGRVRGKRRSTGTSRVENPAGIPADVAAAFDRNPPAQWRAELAKAQDENVRAEQQKQADEAAAHDNTAREIAQAERSTAHVQRGWQVQGISDVAAGRDGWMGEISAADKRYSDEAGRLREEHGGTIDRKKEQVDGIARTKFADAEKEAREKKAAAEREAAEEKRKAKQSSGGFFGWVKRKVKSLIARAKAAINRIIDRLRAAVKAVIEKVKSVVNGLIEAARRVIVGAIRLFGKGLELAADVFLSAFPETKKRAKALIRKGVEKAEAGVNAAADLLKKKVNDALDALGAALDWILSAYQKFYTALLDALEFVIVGLIEIIEGIARLVESARTVPDYFWGQMSEEFLGTDVTAPLPFEMEAPASPAQQKEAAVGVAVAAGAMSSADAAVATTGVLSQSDVVIEHVPAFELPPEVMEQLRLQEGGQTFFGWNADPANKTEELQEAAVGVGAEDREPAATEGAGELTAPAEAAAPAAGGVDPSQMTPEQQLEYLQNQPMEHTCGTPKTEEPAKAGAMPAENRIFGPFTTGQRLGYLVHQMKQGVSHWWECNKTTIILALVGMLLGTALLAVVTGGAILGAIPLLLQVLGAIMVGVAIANASGHIGAYLSKAWGGDVQGGGKSLARGIAILLVELIFAVLFSFGAVLKVIKGALKAVKGGVKGVASASKVALKTAVKGTAKTALKLRRVAVTSARNALRNGKIVFTGLRSGFERGVKSLDDLAKRLTKQFRFKGFSIKLRGLRLELWGHFNPEVKLAEMKLTKAQVQGFFKQIKQAGESLSAATRKQMVGLGHKVGAVKATAPLPANVKAEIRALLREFAPQIISKNKILAQAWENALERVMKSKNFQHMFTAAGDLTANALKDPVAMANLYTEVGKRMRRSTLKALAKEAEALHGIKVSHKLPEAVEIHHLLYKSKFPALAVEMENLMLAMRGPGGPPSELHELWHWLASGAAPARGAGSSFKELHPGVAELIKKSRGL